MALGKTLSARDTRTPWLCQACRSYGLALRLVLILAESILEAVNGSWLLVPAGVPGVTFKNPKDLDCESGGSQEGDVGISFWPHFTMVLGKEDPLFFLFPKCMTSLKYFYSETIWITDSE